MHSQDKHRCLEPGPYPIYAHDLSVVMSMTVLSHTYTCPDTSWTASSPNVANKHEVFGIRLKGVCFQTMPYVPHLQ